MQQDETVEKGGDDRMQEHKERGGHLRGCNQAKWCFEVNANAQMLTQLIKILKD